MELRQTLTFYKDASDEDDYVGADHKRNSHIGNSLRDNTGRHD